MGVCMNVVLWNWWEFVAGFVSGGDLICSGGF